MLVENLLRNWMKSNPEEKPAIITPPVEEPRLPYAERRKKQIADGAKPIPQKERRPSKLKLAWVECSPEQFIDGKDGVVPYKGAGKVAATKFWSQADAIAAEQINFERCGYREEVRRCEVCNCWHVYHRYSILPAGAKVGITAPSPA